MKSSTNSSELSVTLGLGGTIRIGARQISINEAMVLLDAIAATGSVQGVATALGLSYRAAWDRLRTLEASLERQVVRKTRGHGSALTETGIALREALSIASRGLETSLARETRSLQLQLAGLLSGASRRLTVAVSHDLLLMDALAAWDGAEVAVVGSAEAAARLADGRADAAGFHCGTLKPAEAGAPFADLAEDPGFVVRPLFAREQGLLLAPGNPLRIAGIADLAARGARYVNRQAGSGTRVWFDRLLAEAGLGSADTRGYGLEEFTHQAVAAVIASGAADAGLGARAAAERFGLAFVPVGWETYHLATGASLPEEAVNGLVRQVAERVAGTAGYRISA